MSETLYHHCKTLFEALQSAGLTDAAELQHVLVTASLAEIAERADVPNFTALPADDQRRIVDRLRRFQETLAPVDGTPPEAGCALICETNVAAYMRAIARHPTTSDWLRAALRGALERDAVDAANEADELALLTGMRVDALLESLHDAPPASHRTEGA